MSEDKAIIAADLDAARAEASRLSVPFTKNMKAETIRERIQEHLAGDDQEDEHVFEGEQVNLADYGNFSYEDLPRTADGEVDITKLPQIKNHKGKSDYPLKVKQALRKEYTKLVRIKITCMNPAKKDWRGEVFSFINPIAGAIKKFVPYNCEAGDAYHVPYCLYLAIKQKEYQTFSSRKTKHGEVKEPRQTREFAVEVLPQLTQAELDKLAKKQHKGSLEEED